MEKFFNTINPVADFIVRLFDLIILSILWLICCLPIITIGTSTAAMYYVTMKMVRNEDNGIIRCFFRSFKANMKQGIIISLLFTIAGILLYFDWIFAFAVDGVLGFILRILFVVLTLLLSMVVVFTFPLQARFRNTMLNTLKNALLLAVNNFKNTMVAVFMHLLPVLVFFVAPDLFYKALPLWAFVAPASIAYLWSLCVVKIFTSLEQT